MTATQRSSSSPVLWIGLFVVVTLVVAIAFLGRSDTAVGGFADPDGTGPDGLLALRWFIEEAGGDTERDVGLPNDDIDVAILAFGPIPPVTADGFDASREPNWGPLLAWVERGGVLITSVGIDGGLISSGTFETDVDLVVPQGDCSIPSLSGVLEIRPLQHEKISVESGDQSCYGADGEAVVVSRARGEGRIVRLGSIGAFTNRALDDADNGALAARLVEIDSSPTVGFLPAAPVWFAVDDDGEIVLDGDGVPIEDGGVFNGQPLNDEGNPVGAGDSTLLDLIPRSIIAMLLALAGALLLFALSKGRRLGSPIEEPLPIELPSSSYVEAVGRSYERVESAEQRSAAILRHDLRSEIARRVGMPADAPAEQLAEALASGEERVQLLQTLDGPEPTSHEALVATAQQLVATRDRIDRGGVSALAASDEFAASSSPRTRPTQQKDVS